MKNNILEGNYSVEDLEVTVYKSLELSFWCDIAARRKCVSMPVRVDDAMHTKIFKRIEKGSQSDLMPGYDPIETEVWKSQPYLDFDLLMHT